MAIIRVFPRKTSYTPEDAYAFVGYPPLPDFRPAATEVSEIHVSTVFSWDKALACQLLLAWFESYPKARMRLGGPAWNDKANGYFSPGLYMKTGYTFTSRGCNNRCPWCLVPVREGALREIDDIPEGYSICDNNFLQCSATHRGKVYRMLAAQPRAAVFGGGLQPSLVSDGIADELRGLRIAEVFLAADTEGALKPLEKAIRRLSFLPRRKLRCYALLAFGNETIGQAEARLEQIWQLGAMPFAQLYQPAERMIKYGSEWEHLVRKWSRPAAMVATHKETL